MQDKLNMLVEFITKNDINVKGIIINKDSQSYKHYFSNERVNVYSIAKSITALCIFNLENLNLISFDDKMVSFFPEMKYSKGTENITIQNLLDMRSGKDTSFIGDIPTDDEDYLQRFFDFEVTLTQDIFKYSNYCSYTLGRIIEKVTGKVALDYANECIFKKLDIQMPRWSTCNLGYTICAKNLFLNVDELDRVAQLVKNMGIFGTNIIMYKSNFEKFKKEFYVNSKELEYKNSFWNIDIDDGYFMKGIYANMLINIPKQNTTITITANERNNGKRDMLVDYITEIFN